jgi:hypothetical protein
LAAIAETTTAGFEEFAAAGGKMKADPNCFFTDCKEPTKACFTNPACLKGITCLGNCRGEQLCATQCFARFGSEKLNSWLSCTLEEKECVSTGVKQDTSKFYANAPPVAPAFKPSDLEGKWYKVLGYSPKYDMYPCQTNTFTARADGGLENDILFRVPKPDGSGSWTNNFKETMDNSKGPRGTASMVVEGKMFGLTFHEDWYVLGVGKGYRVVAYKGDTQQGPYEGAFVFTETKDALQGSASEAMRLAIDAGWSESPQLRIHTAPNPHSSESPQLRIPTAPNPHSSESPQLRIPAAPNPHSSESPCSPLRTSSQLIRFACTTHGRSPSMC